MAKKKQTTEPTGEQFTALRLMFDHFNAALFGGSLPSVLLNLSRYSRRTIAFFAPDRWRHHDGTTTTHEISLNPAHLVDGSAIETASSLAHEMCHLWQQVHGTPPRRGYHDREWSQKMLAIGLQPLDVKTGQPAMSAHNMDHSIVDGGAFARAFDALPAGALLPWSCLEAQPKAAPAPGGDGKDKDDDSDGDAEPAAPKSRNKVKYSCAKCGANVWGKPGLSLACLDVAEHDDGDPGLFEALAD